MRQKLLIVDDEQGIVDMMRSYFTPRYDVLTAYSGSEALKKVSADPDLILLDINMPGMDGLDVCRQIRAYVSCPILFLTARIESSDKITGFGAGADDYIVKPFDLDELGARVEAHLRREQRRQDNAAVRFFGDLSVDYSARTAEIHGEQISFPGGNLIFWSFFHCTRGRSLTESVSMKRCGVWTGISHNSF